MVIYSGFMCGSNILTMKTLQLRAAVIDGLVSILVTEQPPSGSRWWLSTQHCTTVHCTRWWGLSTQQPPPPDSLTFARNTFVHLNFKRIRISRIFNLFMPHIIQSSRFKIFVSFSTLCEHHTIFVLFRLISHCYTKFPRPAERAEGEAETAEQAESH